MDTGFNTLQEKIGLMGPYQTMILPLLGIGLFNNALQLLVLNMIVPHHDHVCDVTKGREQYNYSYLLTVAPIDENDERDSCWMLDLDWTNTSVDDVSLWNTTLFETHPTVECDQWVFNRKQYENTFTSQVGIDIYG